MSGHTGNPIRRAYAVLIRGINLPKRNRLSMPELRRSLEAAGFGTVSTYLQSGNAVVTSVAPAEAVAQRVRDVLKERLGLSVEVVVRDRAQLAAIVAADPLGALASDPRRHLVLFFAAEVPAAAVERLRAAAIPPEVLATGEREVYVWLPPGVERSRLWPLIWSRSLAATATARNWTTVNALLEMVTLAEGVQRPASRSTTGARPSISSSETAM